MDSKVTCGQEVLRGEDAQRQIDQALLTCFREKRPIYIEMAADIAKLEIDASRFQKPAIAYADSDSTTLQELALDMQQLLQNSKGQMVIGGHEATRYGMNDKLNHFIEKFSLPAMVLNMGKGAIDESSPHYMGLYFGEFSTDNVKQVAMASDVAIVVGGLFADATTDFTHINDAMRFVEIHPNHCRIGKKIYNNIQMSDVLDTLLTLPFHSDVASNPYTPKTFEATNAALTQKRLYELIEWYHKEGGILIGETGTPLYGTVAIRLKAKSRFVGQVLWGSIGYATGATLGTSVADKQNRSLLITGDGSFQLTAQSISTMLYNKLNTIIILINNNGYTIEKVIHGRTRKYNDINMWQYSKLPEVLTTNPDLALSFMVSTEQELFDALLRCDANPDKLALIEVKMGEFDVPWVLDVIAQARQSQHKF